MATTKTTDKVAVEPPPSVVVSSESKVGTFWNLVLCVAGIYACFLTWGLLQERLSSTVYEGNLKFKFFVFLNMLQSLTCTLWAFFYLKAFRDDGVGQTSRDVISKYIAVAISASIASPFGYESLSHINYPTHMLAKSCKLIPVMFMGVLLHRRKYPLFKYVSVLFVTVGVSAFMLLLPAKHGSTSNSWYGLLLVTINMLLDGFTGSTQDELFKKKNVGSLQMMFWMNLFSTLLMLCWIVNPWNPEFQNAVAFCSAAPRAILDIAAFCVCGALGQTFVFRSLGCFGSITLVTITVTRKLFTIILSVIFYGHSISLGQWASIAVVFSGILLEAFPPKFLQPAQLEKKKQN